jgi:hypothetical protein
MTEDKNNKGLWIIALYIVICIVGYYYYIHSTAIPASVNKIGNKNVHIGLLDEAPKNMPGHIIYVVQNKKYYKILSNSNTSTSVKKEISLEEYEKNTH